MNQTATRPTRVPPPSSAAATRTIEQGDPRDAEEASFTEVARTNNLPAARTEAPVNEIAPQGDPQPPLPKTECSKLLGAIAAVMAEITPVEKGGWNKFQSYAFARMQDLLVTITPLMGKHGIVVFQHEEGREMFDSGKAIAVRYRFTIVHKSGEVWFERPLQTGLSTCRNSKDGFDDKSLNKCHTAARKYFLMSLFQIPTEDMEDGDGSGEGQQQGNGGAKRPQARRPVPSPTGKIGPHLLPVIDQEPPEAWAKRFTDFIAKAESGTEIDKWYEVNAPIFEKLKKADLDVYNGLLDAMDARTAALAKPDPISSGKDTFPGDKAIRLADKPIAEQRNGDYGKGTEIPIGLDRQLTDSERDWLISLRDAYNGCANVEEIAAEQDSIMMPSQESVSPHAWKRASDLTDQAIERVQGGK